MSDITAAIWEVEVPRLRRAAVADPLGLDARERSLATWLAEHSRGGEHAFDPGEVAAWLGVSRTRLRQMEDRLARRGLLVVVSRTRESHEVWRPIGQPRGLA